MTWGIPNDFIAAGLLAVIAVWLTVWAISREHRMEAEAMVRVSELLNQEPDDALLLAEAVGVVRNSDSPIYDAVRYEHDLANLRVDMAEFGGETA